MSAEAIHLPFDNSYARMPERLYVRMPPTPVTAPALVLFNGPLADDLGLGHLDPQDPLLAQALAGNHVPAGAEPIAMAYAGHQFGQFVPQLGDGRAILLGEILDNSRRRRDVQLKGSGRTPFSRNGDGRAGLGPVLREYIISEAMHALRIPTTRSLAVVTTGEPVFRETALPGAVLTRVAASHVRVGTFQFFAVRRDQDGVKQLADHVIARHYPEVKDTEEPYLGLFDAVVAAQAQLVAQWMQVGFIHGVMNTDNMAISGETIDYGPCAFMDTFDPATVFSSIDLMGRYAFANQPAIAQWNLARFAEPLLALIDPSPERAVERVSDVLTSFTDRFERSWSEGMAHKLGLGTAEPDDNALISDLLETMHRGKADYTLTFRGLAHAAADTEAHNTVRRLFDEPGAYDRWAERGEARLAREPEPRGTRAAAMRAANPAFIPRNHRVEQALAAAVTNSDFGPVKALLDVLADPFEDRPDRRFYATPPEPSEQVYQTFCGT
ncbi:MAG: YdiU family protein [Geminicoccaceae bacterium]